MKMAPFSAASRNFWWLREAARGLTPIIALKSGSEVAHARTDSDSVEGREMRRSTSKVGQHLSRTTTHSIGKGILVHKHI